MDYEFVCRSQPLFVVNDVQSEEEKKYYPISFHSAILNVTSIGTNPCTSWCQEYRFSRMKKNASKDVSQCQSFRGNECV